MRKGLVVALTVAAALGLSNAALALGPNYGNNIPTVSLIPDVIVGDGAGNAPEQTASGYYVYSGLDLSKYITDEDGLGTVDTAFSLFDGADDYNLSIDGKSALKTSAEVMGWYAGNGIPEDKNLGTGTVTVRGVSDLWSAVGPDYDATGRSDVSSGLGTDGEALANLLVTDDQGNTAVKSVLVKVGAGLDSGVEHDLLSHVAVSNLHLAGFGFAPIVIPGGGNVPAWQAPGFTTNSDEVTIDVSVITSTSNCFSFYEGTVDPDPADPIFQDGVARLRWIIKYDTDSTSTAFKVRSRVGVAGASQLQALASEMELGPSGEQPDVSVQPFIGAESVLNHYFYAGRDGATTVPVNQPSQADGTLLADLDVIRFVVDTTPGNPSPDDRNQRIDRVRGCPVVIDGLIVDVLPHPSLTDTTEYTRIFSSPGDQVLQQHDIRVAGTEPWATINDVAFGGPGTGAGGFVFTNVLDGVNVTATSQTTYNVYGFMGGSLANPADAIVPGALARYVITMRDNLTHSYARPKLRFRMFNETTFEQSCLLAIPDGVPTAGVGPSASGSTYECYMEGPTPLSSLSPADHWGLAIDLISSLGNPRAGGVGVNCNYTITSIALDYINNPN